MITRWHYCISGKHGSGLEHRDYKNMVNVRLGLGLRLGLWSGSLTFAAVSPDH